MWIEFWCCNSKEVYVILYSDILVCISVINWVLEIREYSVLKLVYDDLL